ncbi:MAG: UDP-N-acetylmuramyl-tripeptide synthetase [Candidatus Peregrinibacteria bacterium]
MLSLLRLLKQKLGHRSSVRLAWHHTKALLAAMCYGFPARKLVIIAVTGTDGKTTTVGMISHILQEMGISAGSLSTAFLSVKGATEWNATQKTSPSPFLIQQFLQRLVREGCTHAVLETSSHGLVQGRLDYTWPLVGAVTNTTPEHLDYHGTMEQYRHDKGILIAMIRKNGTKVLSLDDGGFPYFRTIFTTRTITTSLQSSADFRINKTGESTEGIHGIVTDTTSGKTVTLTLHLHGTFNLENALIALGCTVAIGVPLERSAIALQSFRGVPGRLERIDEGQSFDVYVDFTVTPAAYKKTLTTLQSMLPEGKKLLILTGSCGDRMREKRPQVGRICSDLGDVVVVTNEDPYTEDPQKIIDEVWAGIDQNSCEAHQIFDRREAIAFLFAKAEPGDIVILCAKGSDTTMMTATGQIPWNEREIARELLRSGKRKVENGKLKIERGK